MGRFLRSRLAVQRKAGIRREVFSLLHSLGDESLEAANGDGDTGRKVSIGGLCACVNSNAGNFGSGLAGDIGGKVCSLDVPFMLGAAKVYHAIAVAQFVLGLEGGNIAFDGAGGVKFHLGLQAVDVAAGDNTLLNGQGSGVHSQLGIAGLFSCCVGALGGGDAGQAQLVTGHGAQVLGVVHSHFDGGYITAQVNGSDIIATWDGRFLYRGRSNYSSDTLYTFDGKYIYQGRSNYTSDTVATWSNNRLYAGYRVYTSDIIYRVNGVFPPILFVFL